MIKARKSLGQNFLVDPGVSRRIVDAVAPEPRDLIIEIGPGTGSLTRRLTERSGGVIAVEVDPRLVEELRRTLSRPNLRIIEGDALRVDYLGLIASALDTWPAAAADSACGIRVRVVANLPYYISTPIIEKLIGLRARLFDLTLMLQTEVVERIISGPGTRDYGYLSVLVQFYCAASKLFDVPPSAFKPMPRVWSSAVRLKLRESAAVAVDDEARFLALVGASFAQRRKTIANNLKAAASRLGLAARPEAILARAAIEPSRRAETLSIGEFGALYRAARER